MRSVLKTGLLAVLASGAWATTLEQLSMASMIQQSTAIVRARVTSSSAARRGSDIYTYYRLDVLETLKGSPAPSEVAVPGGTVNGVRQTVSGAPKLEIGQEYVLFLWTSRSGLTQVIGLTQGVFSVNKNGTVVRAAATEPMLGPGGQPVKDQIVTLTLEALRQMIRGGAK